MHSYGNYVLKNTCLFPFDQSKWEVVDISDTSSIQLKDFVNFDCNCRSNLNFSAGFLKRFSSGFGERTYQWIELVKLRKTKKKTNKFSNSKLTRFNIVGHRWWCNRNCSNKNGNKHCQHTIIIHFGFFLLELFVFQRKKINLFFKRKRKKKQN